MHFSYIVCAIVAFMCCTSIASSTTIQFPRKTKNQLITRQSSAFTVDTYKVVSRSIARIALALNYMLARHADKESNIVFSPLNIVQTLTSVMLGTAGQTERELANFLGIAIGRQLDERNKAYVHKILGDFLNSVTVEGSNRVDVGLSLMMAGGIFVQEGYPIKPSYIENAKSIYNNDVISINFEDGDAAAAKINQWISEKTNGKIKSIVDASIDPKTKAIITGTLYFNGNWEYPFISAATRPQKFYLSSNGKADKKSVQVEMMVNQALIPYYEDKNRGIQAIGMPYKNKEFYMFLVLPKIGLDVQNMTTCLTPKDIETIVEKSKPGEVFYVVPKMKLEAEYNLRNSLELLGAKTLFSQTHANFSDIADGIFVSQIIHKVTVDVNEIGTTAAAATSTSLNRGGYVNFRADRPFFFFIYNVKVGTMAFWGKVQKPTPFTKNLL